MFFHRPDFFVIAPPKTGTTWLTHNLRRHPDVYVHPVKEVKYFSSLHRVLGLDWYAAHFAPAEGRLAGDISPSYAALPPRTIRRVRELYPDLKLVFLMRDPVGRSWSHVRHAHRYGEVPCPEGACPVARWLPGAADEWELLSGDYLGHLRRWGAVFPPEQLFVAFYEDIANRPVDLLLRVLRFLGARADVPLDGFPLSERVLPGDGAELPPELTRALRGLLGQRTAELVAELRARYGLEPPPEWANTLAGDRAAPGPVPGPFARERDDEYLAGVVAREAQFPTAYRELHKDYRGHDLVYYRGRLLAVDRAVGVPPLLGSDPATVDRLLATRACLTSDTLDHLKERVTDRALDHLAARAADAEARAVEARRAADRAAAAVAALAAEWTRGGLARRAVRRARGLLRRAAVWAT